MKTLASMYQEQLKLGLTIFMLLVACSTFYQPVSAQQAGVGQKVVGEIALTKGVVTARSAQRDVTALAKGSPVYLGDIIETASRSFTVIKFTDGGKVTLRPDSRFDINEYDDTAGQEKESFELIKGGLRAVTGAIGKARPQDVKVTARNTTIGIRGTTFVVRLCDPNTDEGCNYVSDGSDQTVGEADNKFVDIFVVDKDGGQRKRITRRELMALLEGIYISVIDGAIRVSTDDWYVDMQAGDKCLIDQSDGGLTNRDSQDEIECFTNSRGLENTDVFLDADAEKKITLFNLFDDSEIFVGDEICEIN